MEASESVFPNVSTSSDISNSCRVCMCSSSTNTLRCLFNDAVPQESISERLTFCTGLQITKDDGLPTNICELCFHELNVAHRFKTTCLTSDETYHRLLETKVKKEVMEFNNIFDDNFFEDFPEIETKCKVEMDMPAETKKVGKKKVPRAKKPPKQKEKLKPKTAKTKIKTEEDKTLWTKNKTDCEICNVHFGSKKEYYAHRKLMHPKSAFVCEICGKVFRHQSSQSLHQLTHREPKYYCNHCDYRTSYRQDLVTHLRTHTGERRYACTHCAFMFRTASQRTAHIKRTHEKQCRFRCALCDKGFFDMSKLKRHLDSHQDLKKFPCDICDARYTRKQYWKQHMLKQHNVLIPREKGGRKREDFKIEEQLNAEIARLSQT